MSRVASFARISRRALRIAVLAAATVATVALGLIAMLPLLEMRAMTVTSGSMEPTIGVGASVVIEEVDPDTVEAGDVITYAGGTTGGATTHRVIARHMIDGDLYFQTQGDANDTPDVDLTAAEAVIGQVWFDVPHLGRVLSWTQEPIVRFVTLGLVSAWVFITNALVLARALRRRHQPAVSGVAVIALVVGGALMSPDGLASDETSAALVDAVEITDNRFSTGTW